MISSNIFVKACKAYQYDTIPNNLITLHDRNDLKPAIFGNDGRICAIGGEGIPEGIYLYLYVDIDEHNDLYNAISKVVEQERGTAAVKGFVDALGIDADGQTIAVIGIA